ncbi:MAG: Lysine--tRNA ligase [Methanonatronarchaeales archaeon]|nr:Lysine--tRNA ligase [Methanonatronarchaeales archaeon]
MHWAHPEANDAIEERGTEHVVACGISPSGPIHYGNFREVATADLLNRAIQRSEAESDLIWISDDFDPLRKVYPFLPEDFEEHVGKPLSEVPDPDGCHDFYSRHFEEPFLETLPVLGVEPEVKRASEMYASGGYSDAVATALYRTDEIAAIIEEVTGRQLPKGWRPFNPICEECGRFADPAGDEYHCGHGHTGNLSEARGKLPWRVDWPARWKILGVTVEPFGKDHAASGGSYDTGRRIARQVFGYEPPHPVVYEQIGLKGEGEMSSSAGVAVTPRQLLRVMEPELMRFVIASTRPKKHIELDLGHGLPRLYDEVDRAEEAWRNDDPGVEATAFALSTVNDVDEMDLPFSHAVNAVQVDPDDPLKVLRRTHHSDHGPRVEGRLRRARNWVEDYAPESFLFSVQEETPDVELTGEQKRVLEAVAEAVERGGGGDEVQNAIYETGNSLDMALGDAFAAVYRALLGQDDGPRAGPFVAALDRDFVIKRFRDVAGTSDG